MTTAAGLGQEPLEINERDVAEGDTTLWSVTTLIDVLDSPGLTYWAVEQCANAAIDSLATWQNMLETEGREETVKWLVGARYRQPKGRLSDQKLGEVVHKGLELWGLTGTKPTREFMAELIVREGGANVDLEAELYLVGTLLARAGDWLDRAQPEYQATEVCVYSPTYGYAGQADAFATIDGSRFLLDYKSTRKPRDGRGKPKTPYSENALQLAGYRNAEFAAVWRPRRYNDQWKRRYYVLSATERELAVPVPEVDFGAVVLITPEACEAFPIDCDEPVHRSFLYVLEAFRWANELSKGVIGDPLEFE